jgi:hypothetical protein
VCLHVSDIVCVMEKHTRVRACTHTPKPHPNA